MQLLLFFISLLTSVIGLNFYPENIRKYGYLQPADDVDFHELWVSATISENETPVSYYASTLEVTFEGTIMNSEGPNNVPIYSLRGLKYANEPVRFNPPVALKAPYYGEKSIEANQLPNQCAQVATDLTHMTGSEDCLYLNVYTPQMPDEQGNFVELYPVMIFFHGGSFMTGDSYPYLPTRLLDQKVILVVPHYRLGSFGFFSTMDDRAPGNIGLYDQQMAMQWVQDHIKSFGGDKSIVTIFGQSAGSVSANYHLIIPSSKGLMHRVIGESGSALDHWALDEDPLDSAFAIANFLECDNTKTIDDVYKCMKNIDAEKLAVGIFQFSEKDRSEGRLGIRGAAPIIQNPEMDLSKWETEVLITKPPVDYFKDETFNSDVDLMIGANKHEGSYVFGVMYSSYFSKLEKTMNEEYLQEEMIPAILHSFGIDDPTHSLSESLAERYLAGANRRDLQSSIPGLIDLTGVLFIKAGTLETARLHSSNKNQNVKTYLYAFEYEDAANIMHTIINKGRTLPENYLTGVVHSAELLYLFNFSPLNGTQIAIRDALVKLWTNFATYGNPTPDEEEEGWKQLNVTIDQWSEFDTNNEHYMLIEEDSFHIEQRYSDRWTIANDEGPYEKGITTITRKHKTARDSYLAAMIIFIILFAVTVLCCGYLLYKNRNKKTRVQIERKEIDKTKAAKIEQKEVDKKHKSKIEGKEIGKSNKSKIEMDGTTTINIQ